MTKIIALVAMILSGFALGGCSMTVSKLSSHEIKAANGTTQDVSWIVRDGDTVYRCAVYASKPFCVKATFGKVP